MKSHWQTAGRPKPSIIWLAPSSEESCLAPPEAFRLEHAKALATAALASERGCSGLHGGDLGQGLGKLAPVIFGGFPAAAETQSAPGFSSRKVHGAEDVGRFFAAAGASGPGRDGESELIEFHDPTPAAIGRGHQRGNGIPEAGLILSNDLNSGEEFGDELFESIAPLQADFPAGWGELFFAESQCGNGGECAGDVFSSSAPSFLLLSAPQERVEPAGGAFEKTGSLGAAEFMGGTAQEIALSQGGGGHFAEPLDCVAEEWDLEFAAEFEEIGPGLEQAGFVVGGHEGDERGAFAGKSGFNPVRISDA